MANTDNQISIGGAWKNLADINISIGGAWKSISEGHIAIDGSWKQFWGDASRGIFSAGKKQSAPQSNINVIDYITISTTGNAADFGDLTVYRRGHGGSSNSTNNRGIFSGGIDGTNNPRNVIDYITITTNGNASDFGDLLVAIWLNGATSNGVNDRGVMGGGGHKTGMVNTIQYVTISSAGNSTSFGVLTASRGGPGACSNGTNNRGVFCGGFGAVYTNIMDYITITSTGNASDFGDLLSAREETVATSNAANDRGVIHLCTPASNIVEYITISSAGNSTDFGDLTIERRSGHGISSGTNDRGVFGMGINAAENSEYNVIDYITISSTGNASDFGDLTVARGYNLGGCSNA